MWLLATRIVLLMHGRWKLWASTDYSRLHVDATHPAVWGFHVSSLADLQLLFLHFKLSWSIGSWGSEEIVFSIYSSSFLFIKDKLLGVFWSSGKSHPSVLPLRNTYVQPRLGLSDVNRLGHVLLLNPGCKHTRSRDSRNLSKP